MAQLVAVGDQAPDFALPCTTGNLLHLSDLLSSGNALLAFYLLDFAAPCATMLSRLASAASKFAELNTTIVGISVDSVYAHDVFAERLRLPFPLASDFNREVSARYGVLAGRILGLKRVARPAMVLVARDGTIAYRWVSSDPLAVPDPQAALDAAGHLARVP